MKAAFFTICSNNFVPMAKTLFESVRGCHPDADIWLCLADEKIDSDGLYEGEFSVLEARQLDIPNFCSFAFRYNILEFNTAIKPFMFRHLFDAYDYDAIVYLDPDIFLFRPITGILKSLQAGSPFVLTPHLCAPAEQPLPPDDLTIMQVGVFNLGFMASRRCEETIRFLRWWSRQCLYRCVVKLEQGLFVDQKFIDLLPCFVSNVAICRDPTVNVAYWNLSQRELG
ncbi:MAG TPA: hypothetical protein VLI93_17990, partial [Acetobacteraceae bacterium]|nr:hypothetical protein [Acetobacteraceae bacterium]